MLQHMKPHFNCLHAVFFVLLLSSIDLFSKSFFSKDLPGTLLSFKQFGSRLGPTCCRSWSWFVYKGYQQTTMVANSKAVVDCVFCVLMYNLKANIDDLSKWFALFRNLDNYELTMEIS